MKNSLSSYVRNTAFRPAGLSRGSSSSEGFWNAPFSLSNSSIFSPVNCWNTRGFVLASSYFIFFPPLPSFYSLLHAFPIDSKKRLPWGETRESERSLERQHGITRRLLDVPSAARSSQPRWA